jgi:hypothetical protein
VWDLTEFHTPRNLPEADVIHIKDAENVSSGEMLFLIPAFYSTYQDLQMKLQRLLFKNVD